MPKDGPQAVSSRCNPRPCGPLEGSGPWALPSYRRGKISCDLSDGLRPQPGPALPCAGRRPRQAPRAASSPGPRRGPRSEGAAVLHVSGKRRGVAEQLQSAAQCPCSGDGADVYGGGEAGKPRRGGPFLTEGDPGSELSERSPRPLRDPPGFCGVGHPGGGAGVTLTCGNGERRDPRAAGGGGAGRMEDLTPQPISPTRCSFFWSTRPIGRSGWILRKPGWALRGGSRTVPCRP